jgi:hypothetical protein
MRHKILTQTTILLLLISFGSCGKSSTKEARIKIESDALNLGDVYDSSALVVKIKSIGSDTLKLIKIAAACGCTQVNAEKDNIPPGDSTFLRGKFTPEALGQFEKSIVLNTNSKKKFHVIRIRGNTKTKI